MCNKWQLQVSHQLVRRYLKSQHGAIFLKNSGRGGGGGVGLLFMCTLKYEFSHICAPV